MPSLAPGFGWLTWVLTLPGVVPAPAIQFDLPDALVAEAARAQAVPAAPASRPGLEFFLSWGYNGNSFTRSDLHISQPSLGNDFTFVNVEARDSKGWTDLFNHSLTVPQYNVRFGVFFNDKWGAEIAMDHIKWIVRQDQVVRMTGTLGGESIDQDVTLTEDVLAYRLNNGANPVFFNLIRRVQLFGESRRTGYTTLLLKAGAGFAMPHTENTLFGEPNDKGFQFFHGWNVGAGAAVRAHLWRGVYFEVEDKFVYARYFGVKVDRGTARHSLKANEFTFNFGYAFW